MRLRTQLVVSVTALTFAIVLVLSSIFVGELLRQRIEQAAGSTDVLAHEVLLMTRQAVETGLREHPPQDRSDAALHQAVTDALRDNDALADVMNAVVRYSPTVQDVSVTDPGGMTLVSTDPEAMDQGAPKRTQLSQMRDGGVLFQMREVFGAPHVLETTLMLQRNGKPFLEVRVGVQSTFLRNSYAPWLKAVLAFTLLAGLGSVVAAGLLANLALLPLEQISRRLEQLTASASASEAGRLEAENTRQEEEGKKDAVVRVTRTIERLGEQMRTTEAGYTTLRTNLNQMLDALRDGVLLFTPERRAIMVSDAVEHFLNEPVGELVGKSLEEIFPVETALGAAVEEAFAGNRQVIGHPVVLEDGRRVELTLDRIGAQDGTDAYGTLLTLRDTESALQIEQELEVSRRLAEIGRLTAGVGHEVKNPINAMVVHLELLRGKLSASEASGNGALVKGAQRHVEILAGEMQRLDRVVQTLADFSRPMELHLEEQDLREGVSGVMELTAVEMHENGVRLTVEGPREPLMVRVDPELLRQALLNLLLNGMQAMPEGGALKVNMRRERGFAIAEIKDEGEGIPAEVLPRIFELYFTTKPKGSGIGLAMTYRIVQMHGGALEVRTKTDAASGDRGTTFLMRLPLVPGGGEGRRAVLVPAVRSGELS